MTADQIVRALGGRRGRCACPSCRADGRDSGGDHLAVREDGGRLLVHCFAGCPQSEVIAALKGLGLWPEHETRQTQRGGEWGPVVARYDYLNASGEPAYQVRRHEPKRFSQWRYHNGEWLPGLKGCPRLLYRLSEVLTAPIVFIVEGEKDVESLRDMGFVATTCSGGAGKWAHEFDPIFAGKEVVILPDADAPGMRHARDVAAGLLPYARRLTVVVLPGVKDVSEWFAAGNSEVALIQLVEMEVVLAN